MILDLKKDIVTHIAVTASIAFGLYFWSGSVKSVFFCVASGIFIDLDHLVDYFVYFKLRFKLSEFLCSRQVESGHAYLILHSWELLLFLCPLAANPDLTLPVFAILLGFIGHLFADQFRRSVPFAYFLSYRIYARFKIENIFPELLESAQEN
jgi:hypothetical protein